MTTATRPLLLLATVAAISAGCGGASGNVAATDDLDRREDRPRAQIERSDAEGGRTDGDSRERSAVELRALAQPASRPGQHGRRAAPR